MESLLKTKHFLSTAELSRDGSDKVVSSPHLGPPSHLLGGESLSTDYARDAVFAAEAIL
jgi:hypothetical protein